MHHHSLWQHRCHSDFYTRYDNCDPLALDSILRPAFNLQGSIIFSQSSFMEVSPIVSTGYEEETPVIQ